MTRTRLILSKLSEVTTITKTTASLVTKIAITITNKCIRPIVTHFCPYMVQLRIRVNNSIFTFVLLNVVCTPYVIEVTHILLFCILLVFFFPFSFFESNYSLFRLWISYMSISTCVPDFICVECTLQKVLVKG